MNNTAEKEKEFLACIDNVYQKVRSQYRGVEILKDGRIIYYEELEKKKYINISTKNLCLTLNLK